MFSQKFIFIFIFEYPLRIISELIKILVDTLIKYYTDVHDVDEETRATARCGGNWVNEVYVGIMRRDMQHNSTDYYDYVASLKNIGHSR